MIISVLLELPYLLELFLCVAKIYREGSNTKGYFVWSFVDAFELLYGYNYTFGLYYVNFSDPNQTRYPKISQRWYSNFLKGENVSTDNEGSQHENMITIYKPVLDVDDRFSIWVLCGNDGLQDVLHQGAPRSRWLEELKMSKHPHILYCRNLVYQHITNYMDPLYFHLEI